MAAALRGSAAARAKSGCATAAVRSLALGPAHPAIRRPLALLRPGRHGATASAAVPRGARLRLQAASGGGNGSGGGSGGAKPRGFSSGGGGSGDGGGSSGGLWAAYASLLESNPLLVKAVTTAVLSALGNLVCQLLVERKEQLDWRRFSIFTALGFVWVAPCLHYWFGVLNRLVTAPGNGGALARMGLDQLGFAPLFISSMIAILTLLDGKGAGQAAAAVRADLPSAIQANWALWVPAQFLNFRFVPAAYQVLFANAVALAWNVYFSFATRPKEAAAAAAPAAPAGKKGGRGGGKK